MKQSRAASMVEAVANVAVGFGIAVLTQAAVFPMFGFHAAASQHVAIALIFTVVSLVRSFALRRVFEALRVRNENRRPQAADQPPAVGRSRGGGGPST